MPRLAGFHRGVIVRLTETLKNPGQAAASFGPTPVWLVPGADGKDWMAGTDGRVYAVSQLPMSALP